MFWENVSLVLTSPWFWGVLAFIVGPTLLGTGAAALESLVVDRVRARLAAKKEAAATAVAEEMADRSRVVVVLPGHGKITLLNNTPAVGVCRGIVQLNYQLLGSQALDLPEMECWSSPAELDARKAEAFEAFGRMQKAAAKVAPATAAAAPAAPAAAAPAPAPAAEKLTIDFPKGKLYIVNNAMPGKARAFVALNSPFNGEYMHELQPEKAWSQPWEMSAVKAAFFAKVDALLAPPAPRVAQQRKKWRPA
jgi:hypothetical protein